MTITDKDWYLVAVEHGGKIITPPNVTVFDTVAIAAMPFTYIGTLTQRVGNRSWAGFGHHRQYIGDASVASTDAYASQVANEHRFIEEAGIWTRMEGAKATLAPRESSSHQGKSDIDYWRAELGFDMPIWRPTAGSALVAGFSGHFGGTKTEIKDLQLSGAKGSILNHGQGIGATLTWYGEYGFYVDAVARLTWYKSDMKAEYQGLSDSRKNNNGFAQVYSLEAGKIFTLDGGWSITPQVQYTHSVIQNDAFIDQFGDKFSYKNMVGKLLRLGTAVNREWNFCSASGDKRRFEVYGVANMYREFDSGTEMKHDRTFQQDTVTYTTKAEKWWAGASVGTTYDWADSRYSVYGEIGYRTTLKHPNKNHILHGEVGFRYNF